jgi:hypothetical protein
LTLLVADDLEIGEVHQVQEIGGGDIVDLRLLVSQPKRFGGFEDRLPEMGIIGDDDPCRGRTELMN